LKDAELIDRIDALLPQTSARCGYAASPLTPRLSQVRRHQSLPAGGSAESQR